MRTSSEGLLVAVARPQAEAIGSGENDGDYTGGGLPSDGGDDVLTP